MLLVARMDEGLPVIDHGVVLLDSIILDFFFIFSFFFHTFFHALVVSGGKDGELFFFCFG